MTSGWAVLHLHRGPSSNYQANQSETEPEADVLPHTSLSCWLHLRSVKLERRVRLERGVGTNTARVQLSICSPKPSTLLLCPRV